MEMLEREDALAALAEARREGGRVVLGAARSAVAALRPDGSQRTRWPLLAS
jgi:hypothetical protein